MTARIRAVLPARWFADETPILDAVLTGLGTAWAWIYDLLGYVTSQTRISTASDIWLDVIAQDYFGTSLVRGTGESDSALRQRIQRELFRDRATRAAISAALTDLTGHAPIIFEPLRPADTGGYGSASNAAVGLAYGATGGWGTLTLPYQCFVTAYRPTGSGIAQVSGWGASAGGFGIGSILYATTTMIDNQVTDLDIAATVAAVAPTATIAWLRIVS